MKEPKELLGKAVDPGFWAQFRTQSAQDCAQNGIQNRGKQFFENYREELLKTWDTCCEGQPIPSLSYSDFALFFRTGDRAVYQRPYFARRTALETSALLSLIYPEEDKYIRYLMDVIFAVCDEYTWCLPAHQKQLDKNDNCKVDLFASETAFTLAEISVLLGERLDPLIRDRIRVEIDRRVISSVLSKEPYDWWEKTSNNWAAVCMGSVGCTVMLARPELFETMKPRFEATMERFLGGFSEDGVCLEGCSYWHYGFGHFVYFADMIRRFTDGEIDYFASPKVRKIAGFVQKMYLSGNACVSFSDCGRSMSYHLGLLHYLKTEYPGEIRVYAPEMSYTGVGTLANHLRSAIWYNEEFYTHPDGQEDETFFSEDAGWLVKKTPAYGFAAKGGNNNEMHNHNDVGTFIFAKNGRQMITDIGKGTYTRQYFSSERYSILQCSSRSHSVPLIGGQEQFDGKEAAAKATSFDGKTFRTEISGAYKAEGLTKLARSFTFDPEGVTMTDEIAYSGGEVTERFASLVKPECGDGAVMVDEARIEYDRALCEPVINCEKTPEGTDCWFVDFVLPEGTGSFTVKIS